MQTRPSRPTILLSHQSGSFRVAVDAIMAEASVRGWQLLNLSFSDGLVPPTVTPQGTIVDLLYDAPQLEPVRQSGCPIVRLGSLPHPCDTRAPAVLPDIPAAGRLAATHLAARGFRALGFVGYRGHGIAAVIRNAYREQAEELGCTFHLLEVGGEKGDFLDRNRQRLEREKEWLLSMPRPFAVFTYSDLRAGQICSACLAAGLKVPEEVAILGYGNFDQFCCTAPVALSAVNIDHALFGREAARLLQGLMDGRSPPGSTVLIQPTSVVQRQSTNVLAVPHAGVARALRFLWDHLDSKVTVSDVAREVGMSRTGINGAFRKHLGRSVNAELVRKRLERCAELLLSTDLSVKQIADATGFPTRTYLYRAFRKAYGLTPRQYRLRHESE